jgi:hypothetical protein
MLSRNRPIVRTADTRDRTSAGIDNPPSTPADDVELARSRISGECTDAVDGPPEWSLSQLSSLEMLRQLETCVRELLEVNSKGR